MSSNGSERKDVCRYRFCVSCTFVADIKRYFGNLARKGFRTADIDTAFSRVLSSDLSVALNAFMQSGKVQLNVLALIV